MPKTITTEVYTYSELSEDAQSNARLWYLESAGYDISEFAFDGIKEDAQRVGLKIEYLDDTRANKGEFEASAPECAESIIAEHGAMCETYKTAKAYLNRLNENGLDHCEAEDGTDERDEWEQEREELDNDFLQALLEDYRIMLNREIEYQKSDEAIAETMAANEYTFTESGKRFG